MGYMICISMPATNVSYVLYMNYYRKKKKKRGGTQGFVLLANTKLASHTL